MTSAAGRWKRMVCRFRAHWVAPERSDAVDDLETISTRRQSVIGTLNWSVGTSTTRMVNAAENSIVPPCPHENSQSCCCYAM